MSEKKVDGENKVEEKGGELLFCGATDWNIIGLKIGFQSSNLVSPTRLRPLLGVPIRFAASGCVSCHCVALDVEGRCYTWGRNEKGQLGHGDKIQRDRPTAVSELSKYKIVRAAGGRSHTVVVTEDGHSLAFGWNKHGQLGSGSVKNEVELSPIHCLVSGVKNTACGGEFTVWLSSGEGASILTAGLPQYGQLGHGTDNEYNTKEGCVKLAYEAQPHPRAIASLSGETIVKVACGVNHTVAVDANGYVYTWGFGGYGRLAHTIDILKSVFMKRWGTESKKTNGHLAGWMFSRGKICFLLMQLFLPVQRILLVLQVGNCGCGEKATSDNWMYPKPIVDLSGWNVQCMDLGNLHHFVGAENSCISWGQAHYGELGYGPAEQRSSATPKKVEILEGMHVIGVACGRHSMVIVDRTNVADRLEQLEIYEGKAIGEVTESTPTKPTPAKQNTKRGSAKASKNSNKRKKPNGSSKPEEVEEADVDESEDTDEQVNSCTPKSKRGGKASARGGNKGGQGQGGSPQVKTGKRGRPRKAKNV